VQTFKKIFDLQKNFKYFIRLLEKNYDLNCKVYNTNKFTMKTKQEGNSPSDVFGMKTLLRTKITNRNIFSYGFKLSRIQTSNFFCPTWKIKYLNELYLKKQTIALQNKSKFKVLLRLQRKSIFKQIVQKE